jgi:hypothetical protein
MIAGQEEKESLKIMLFCFIIVVTNGFTTKRI